MLYTLLLLGACQGLTQSEVTAGDADAGPELKPLAFSSPPGPVVARARRAARSMPGWGECDTVRPYEFTCPIPSKWSGREGTARIWVEVQGPLVSLLMFSATGEGPMGLGDLGGGAEQLQAFRSAYEQALAEERSAGDAP